MGCGSSKLDSLPAVSLCRERCELLNEAIKLRFDLAEAHLCYMQSLKNVGSLLTTFLNHDVNLIDAVVDPVLALSSDKNGVVKITDVIGSSSSELGHSQHLILDTDSHLHLSTDSDELEEDDSLRFLKKHNHLEPGVTNLPMSGNIVTQFQYSSEFQHEIPVPLLFYEQKQFVPETGYMDQSSCYNYSFNVYDHEKVMDDSFGSVPLAPPSPLKESSWDFLNPFESMYDLSYSVYPSSRELKEVREEEGIPELEETVNDDLNEVVKEFYDKKSTDVGSTMAVDTEIVVIESLKRASEREERITAGVSECETSAKDDEPRCVSDIVKAIHAQFVKASETCNELAEFLESGRLPYRKNHGAYLAPSKMLNAITTSLPVVVLSHQSKSVLAQSSSLAAIDAMKTKSLSSTLQKLYLWEKKLCNEVKAEEKMRVLHDRKRRKLMQLDAKGANADKVFATRALVRSLGTKMKVAIQVTDRISNTLNNIRDEELLSHINQLIQGFATMWESILECHRIQLQAISEARNLDEIVVSRNFSEANIKLKLDLERELINWALRFSSWIRIQKDFAKALNNWLFKYLLYEPEETPNRVAPFSPRRIGAPLIFVICNEWVQSLEQVSEKQIVDSIRGLAASVFSVWERDRLILRQNMVTNKEFERQIQKEILALDKQIVSVSKACNNGLPLLDADAASCSLHESLRRVFDSMEKFTTECTKVYKELVQCSEEAGGTSEAS